MLTIIFAFFFNIGSFLYLKVQLSLSVQNKKQTDSLRQVGGFLRVFMFPPPITLTVTI